MSDFIFPLRARPTISYQTGVASFGARRSGGRRKHAACDLYAPAGTEILAIEDGTIIQGPYYFYDGTYALEVRHDSGYIVRYSEIRKKVPRGITAGARVSQGQVIAYIGFLIELKLSMLHFEMYDGSKTGPLTQSGNIFRRRSDLVDPTPFLNAAPLVSDRRTLDPGEGRVNNNVTSTLNVRSTANTSSVILTQLSPQTIVKVIKFVKGGTYIIDGNSRDDWTEIQVGGIFGFVASYFLDVAENSPPTIIDEVGQVNSRVSTNLNVRNRADTSATVLFTLSLGDTVQVLQELQGGVYDGGKSDWLEIEFDGKRGFVAAYYININEGPIPQNRWDVALPNVPTDGASAVTARQDGLPPGIVSSQKMAQTDLPRIKAVADLLSNAAAKFGVPAAVIAALASRESRGGNVLDANGYGDRGNAFGILQVDKRFHTLEGTSDPRSLQHIEQAVGIFADYLEQVEKKHPSWENEYLLKGGIVAYNAGVSTVQTKAGVDIGSTGNDYGSDVIARAKYYLNNVELPMFRK